MLNVLAIAALCLAGLQAPATEAPKEKEKWVSLFDGKSMGGWKKTDYAAGGEVRVEAKFPKEKPEGPAIVVEMGDMLSGFHWSPKKDEKQPAERPASSDPAKIEIPKTNFEVSVEFMRVDGYDFPLGLTFPVGESHATLVLGGWGGSVVGISSIDGMDASENETTKLMTFTKGKWYRARMRVTPERLQAWIDDKPLIDQNIKGRKISLRPGEISQSVPIGIATFRTTAVFRNIKLRKLEPAEAKP